MVLVFKSACVIINMDSEEAATIKDVDSRAIGTIEEVNTALLERRGLCPCH